LYDVAREAQNRPDWKRGPALLYRSGIVGLTLLSEHVSLNRLEVEVLIHPRRRGGGNAGIGTIVFRAFHKPSFPRPVSITLKSQAAVFTLHLSSLARTSSG
jgi:hypothetical protein